MKPNTFGMSILCLCIWIGQSEAGPFKKGQIVQLTADIKATQGEHEFTIGSGAKFVITEYNPVKEEVQIQYPNPNISTENLARSQEQEITGNFLGLEWGASLEECKRVLGSREDVEFSEGNSNASFLFFSGGKFNSKEVQAFVLVLLDGHLAEANVFFKFESDSSELLEAVVYKYGLPVVEPRDRSSYDLVSGITTQVKTYSHLEWTKAEWALAGRQGKLEKIRYTKRNGLLSLRYSIVLPRDLERKINDLKDRWKTEVDAKPGRKEISTEDL